MKLFHDLLEMRGYNIQQARDGAEVLKLASQHHPGLMVMDIQLPGMPGLVLKAIPIIAVTAPR